LLDGGVVAPAERDVVKMRIARRLRCETALTLRRIAELLHMGAPTYVAHLLYHRREDV
jgi:hypothetical protein